MAVYVNWIIPASTGPVGSVGRVVARAAITIPGSTTRRVQPGELVVVTNGESSAVAVAWGSTPDAAATDETSVTSAGLAIPSEQVSPPLDIPPLSLINVKAL
jgi:hypothetical protein